VGEPPYPNAKVFSLDAMTRVARHDLLVMSDSDIRVKPDMLRVIAAEFADPNTGLATCPYRAIAGASFWTRLEAVGMNTQFLAGLLAARMLEGMKFAVGPTIAARKSVLAAIGGFDTLKDFLAEDFVMGKLAFEAGFGVILSSCVIEHHIGSQPFRKNAAHRLRWRRSTRCSRPKGYLGEIFTNPLPLASLLVAVDARWWPLAAAAAALRFWSAWWTSVRILHAPLAPAMILLEDYFAFLFWIAGFFGNIIEWRGIAYRLSRDGRFHPIN
jgi:ceramide glucosyltransferase